MTTTPQSADAPAGALDAARHGSYSTQAAGSPLLRGFFRLLFVALAVVLATGLYHARYFERLASFATPLLDRHFHAIGITVQKIVVTGQVNLADEDILDALGIRTGQSLFGFDAQEAQRRLGKLNMVRKARVMRLLPSTLLVEIEERSPFARWQRADGRIVLIDRDGIEMTASRKVDPAAYPLVSGDKPAAEGADQLMRLLTTHEDLAGNVAMARYVAGGRWDVVARSGAVLRLPANDVALALARFVRLPDWRELLGQSGTVVDMRLPDRAFVRRGADWPPTPASSG